MSAQDTINTLDKKLEQVKSIIGSLCSNDHFTDISSNTISGNLWAVADLTEDLQHLSEDLWEQIKPQGDSNSGATVMCGDEPIPDLERELIAVMREMTKELEDVVVTGRGFLNDIDKRDKTA